MVNRTDSNKARIKRHQRVRNKISGTPERPRLSVYRSLKHIYAQLIDDVNGVTLVSASTVGKLLAERATAKGIDACVFDRGGYIYHGRVQSLAEGAREGGLKF